MGSKKDRNKDISSDPFLAELGKLPRLGQGDKPGEIGYSAQGLSISLPAEQVALSMTIAPEARKALMITMLSFARHGFRGFQVWMAGLSEAERTYIALVIRTTDQLGDQLDQALPGFLPPDRPGYNKAGIPLEGTPDPGPVRSPEIHIHHGMPPMPEALAQALGGVPIRSGPDSAMLPIAVDGDAIALARTIIPERRAALVERLEETANASPTDEETEALLMAWVETLANEEAAYISVLLEASEQFGRSGLFAHNDIPQITLELIESLIRG